MMFGPEPQADRVPPLRRALIGGSVWRQPRRYAVYRGNVLVGSSHLEYPVATGSRAAGRFAATPAFAAIAYVFDLYRDALKRADDQLMREYVLRRDQLGLEIWEPGIRLRGSVDLISTWAPRRHMLHVTCDDDRLWRWRSP